jgi:Domain of unknown function (DUF4412)
MRKSSNTLSGSGARLLFFLILIISLTGSYSFSQSSFEGKVTMKVTSEGKSNSMNYLIKGDKMRIDFSQMGHASAMIMDMNAKKSFVLMPEQKMYMEINMGNFEDMAKNEKKDIEFKMTDVTKNINGFNCVKWIYKSKDAHGDMWMTKDLGSFMMYSNPMGHSQQPEWMKKIQNEGYFPMLVTVYDNNDKTTSELEVTSVEKQNLDASLFAVPPDYKLLQMPNMQH